MHWLSAGAGASCPDLSCQRGQTKKQVKKSCNGPKPLRCMPLGYVFYRQFSGLPVSTLAVFFDYNLRKESREKELPVTHVFDEMFVSYNSLKDFFEIHVFSPVRKWASSTVWRLLWSSELVWTSDAPWPFCCKKTPRRLGGMAPIPPWELGLAALRFRHDLCPDRCLATIWSDPTSFQ